jgi:hypothetical protein
MGIFNKLAGVSTADILSGEIRTRLRTMGSDALAALAYEHAIKLAQTVGPTAVASAAKSTAIIKTHGLKTLRVPLPLFRRVRRPKRL